MIFFVFGIRVKFFLFILSLEINCMISEKQFFNGWFTKVCALIVYYTDFYIINNSRQKSGYLLQMRLLAYRREDRIFLLFPDLLFDFSIARLTIWGIRSIRHHSNPASGNARCHRLRLHAVPRMWHFLRSVFCSSRAYAFSAGDAHAWLSRRYFVKILK